MKQTSLMMVLLTVALFFMCVTNGRATTYKLTKVTSVSAGNKYVFERNSRVLSNTVSSNAIQTTATYSTTGLAGTESYVWKLETATGGYYMRNVSLGNKQYLNNASSTNMSFGSKSSVWSLTFTDDKALISNTSNSDRFLGETDHGSNIYKAYATSNLSSYEHDFTVYVLEEESDVSVTGVTMNHSALSITYGQTDETLTATVAPVDANNKSVTWSSSNEQVATVNASGHVTAVAVGTATITVTTEDGNYTATCEVTVTADATKPSLTETVFEETFANVQNGIANIENFDNIGWSIVGTVNVTGDNYIVLASTSNAGSITTPALTGMKTGATLSFKAQAWSSTEKTINIRGTNCTVSPTTFTDLPTYPSFASKEVSITVTGENPEITFSADSEKRAIIDDITIHQPVEAIDVRLSATGYASCCSPFALDLTPTTDYAAWVVTGTNAERIVLSKIAGKVAANTPFILYNSDKAGEIVSLPVIDDDDADITAVGSNMLVGTLSPTYVTTVNGDYTNYGLSGDSFLKINDGTIPANKAFLPVLTANVPALARLPFVFADETNGISSMHNDECIMHNEVYDLQGRRVAQPTKGLYIVNGKKVIMK